MKQRMENSEGEEEEMRERPIKQRRGRGAEIQHKERWKKRGEINKYVRRETERAEKGRDQKETRKNERGRDQRKTRKERTTERQERMKEEETKERGRDQREAGKKKGGRAQGETRKKEGGRYQRETGKRERGGDRGSDQTQGQPAALWRGPVIECKCPAMLPSSAQGETHHPVDSVSPNGALGHDHQVCLHALLLQVLAAIAAVPGLHIKLPMQALHGALRDVHTSGGGEHRE